ncbi:MAG: LPS export ABC transporter periplasmic protein LptC [Tatlockia sp.]|nr:LPS export ABC transporter periplasmic protein LptC [Tatlockia sp.]
MNFAKQAAWLSCVLVALACSSFYFANSKPPKRLDALVLSQTADMVISNMVVKRFNETGQLVHFLKSPEIKHVPEHNTFFLTLPQLALRQEDQPAWEISSKKAKAINGGEQVTFIGDVVIHQAKTDKTQESTIKTASLDYFSKTKIAKTEEAVSFFQPGSIVYSKGMKAFFEEKRVQLNQARATFEPKHA